MKSGNLEEVPCHPIPTHCVAHTDVNISAMLMICVTARGWQFCQCTVGTSGCKRSNQRQLHNMHQNCNPRPPLSSATERIGCLIVNNAALRSASNEIAAYFLRTHRRTDLIESHRCIFFAYKQSCISQSNHFIYFAYTQPDRPFNQIAAKISRTHTDVQTSNQSAAYFSRTHTIAMTVHHGSG